MPRFIVNEAAVHQILKRVSQDFYNTPLETEAPRVTGGYYTEESVMNENECVAQDRAVELLRDERTIRAEERARQIVDDVHELEVADKPTGSVITFTKNFNGKRTYTYVALKFTTGSVNLWTVTGQAGRLLDEELEEFLARDGGFDNYRYIDVIAQEGDTDGE